MSYVYYVDKIERLIIQLGKRLSRKRLNDKDKEILSEIWELLINLDYELKQRNKIADNLVN